MKKFAMAVVIVGAVTGGNLMAAMPASAADSFSFSFNTGDVAFGYSDGYWDHDHNWHRWRNAREAREFRARYSDHYQHRAHTRERNGGWRDDDGLLGRPRPRR